MDMGFNRIMWILVIGRCVYKIPSNFDYGWASPLLIERWRKTAMATIQ